MNRGQILEGLKCQEQECDLQPKGSREPLKFTEQKQDVVKRGDREGMVSTEAGATEVRQHRGLEAK